jgi:hypothetical protein
MQYTFDLVDCHKFTLIVSNLCIVINVRKWIICQQFIHFSFNYIHNGCYVTKRERVRSTNAHLDKFNRPSIKPNLWGLFPPPTFVTSASTFPQILLNSQPGCTHSTSHTRYSHHIHNHHSDHSHRACISFIKNCTETCYSFFERICHRIGQSIKNSTDLSKYFEYIHTFTIALIYYPTQLRQLHPH